MTNSSEIPPALPPKPVVETPQHKLPVTEPQIPDAPAPQEQPLEQPQPSIKERVSVDALTPEHAEIAGRMLKPIQNPEVNALLRKAAKVERAQFPAYDGPVVPSTADEMAEYERRYDSGWQDSAVPQNPEAFSQKEREDLENLRAAVELMDQFELTYPLPELRAITHISVPELIVHPIRKPANIALVHIRKAIDAAGSKKIPEIEERYLSLSQAVGRYNSLSKSVEHD